MNRIKELRKEKSITQKDLSEGIKTSQRNIDRWENEKNEPSSSALVKLADFFECSIDYLLGREDDFGNVNTNSDLTERERKLLYLYNQLPETRQKTVLDTIEAMLEPLNVRSNI